MSNALENVKASGLELKALAKTFGSHPALHPTTLAIPAGRFTTILGPSGCGKSTTLMLIAGIESPTSGTVLLDGKDITHEPIGKRRIGIVFQDYALFPNLTVAQNIVYGLKAQKASDAQCARRLEQMLELTKLKGLQHRYPSELSGGQQQRVAIARALAPHPRLLLLDEPLSALDAWSRASIGAQLKAIQQAAGVTTIMVTHDRHEALSLADFVVVMNAGRVEQAASPVEIYDTPASEFVAAFVGGMNTVRISSINDGAPTGIRYSDVRLARATEASLSQPFTFVGQVEDLEFMGDAVRVTVLLNDFKTKITADALRARTDAEVFQKSALIAVELPASAWRTWSRQ